MTDKKEPLNETSKQDIIKEAARTASADIRKDPDLQPDTTPSADLDEGELARLDNSND
jgi:hypothetical protein